MPLLSIFGRNKNKDGNAGAPPARVNFSTTASASSHDDRSQLSHPSTAEYVHAHKQSPSSPNGSGVYPSFASTSTSSSPSPKKRIAFGRKMSGASTSSAATTRPGDSPSKHPTNGRPTYLQTQSVDDRLSYAPPPPKSALFSSHAGGSTQSLPTSRSRADSDAEIAAKYLSPDAARRPPGKAASSALLTPAPKEKKGFFSWGGAKSKGKQKSDDPPPLPKKRLNASPLSHDKDSSFNLKSFRHVNGASSTNLASSLSQPNLRKHTLATEDPPPMPGVPPARPRPRGTSVAGSDSSQRISVAAFREAQARRSTAGSPVPGQSRNGSRIDLNLSTPGTPSLHPSPNSQFGSPQLRSISPNPAARPRSQTVSQFTTPDSGLGRQPQKSLTTPDGYPLKRASRAQASSDEEESEEEDSDDEPIGKSLQRTQPGKGKAQSEIGHGVANRPHSSYVLPEFDLKPHVAALMPRSQSSLGVYDSRPRASASTSAMVPDAAAKRASILAAGISHVRAQSGDQRSNSYVKPPLHQAASSDSDSEDDDAPLATLLPPRRPGSAASHRSASSNPDMRNHSSQNINVPYGARSQSNLPSPIGRKPLIDINTLTAPMVTPAVGPGFTGGSTLLGAGKPPKFVSPANSFNAGKPETRNGRSESATGTSMLGLSLSLGLGRVLGTDRKESSDSPPPPVAKDSPKPSPVPDFLGLRAFTSSPDLVAPSATQSPQILPPSTERKDSTPATSSFNDRLNRVVQANLGKKDVESLAPTSPPSSAPSSSSPSRKPSASPRPEAEETAGTITIMHRRTSSDYTARAAPLPTPSPIPAPAATSASNDDSDKEDDSQSDRYGAPDGDSVRIVPKVIKQRAPAPAFSVMSRPKHSPRPSEPAVVGSRATPSAPSSARPRSSTLDQLSGVSNPKDQPATTAVKASVKPPPKELSPPTVTSRVRTTTLASPTTTPTGILQQPGGNKNLAVSTRPFARRESPATSSTGDSSSGRAPLTPQDGSDIVVNIGGNRSTRDWSGDKDSDAPEMRTGVSGLGGAKGKHARRTSVQFDTDLERRRVDRPSDKVERVDVPEDEARRKERRRSEAKAAIELGNVINGRGPIDDDDDEDVPINQTRGSRMMPMNANPMMGMGMGGPLPMPMQMPMPMGQMGFNGMPAGSPGWAPWGQQQPMMPQTPFMMMPNASDPNLMAAHQQAMMMAKQAYQMAVAQQAMIAAGDEWERGSTVGGFGGGMSVYDGGSVYGGARGSVYGGGGGSVYGGGGSVYGGGGSAFGGWNGSPMFSGAQSAYGGASRSEYGGGGGGRNGWNSSRSVYGESFGDRQPQKSGQRQKTADYFSTPAPPVPRMGAQVERAGRARTSSNPLVRLDPTPSPPLRKKPQPPSSWKLGT